MFTCPGGQVQIKLIQFCTSKIMGLIILNLHVVWKTVYVLITPADLDLHCFQLRFYLVSYCFLKSFHLVSAQ